VGFLRRHGWWLLPELVALAVIAAGLVYLRPNAFVNQLSDKARTVLEQTSPTEQHLHELSGQPGKVICAAESFGTEPAGATRVEEVRVIYALYLCAVAVRGMPWDYATRSSGPVAITLTDPPTIQIPVSGEGYPERVRALIPDNLEGRAFGTFKDKGRPAALRTQYEHEIA
jgi:hypothetical protein